MQNLVENIKKKFEEAFDLREGSISRESYQTYKRVIMDNIQTELEIIFLTMKDLFHSLETFRNKIARYAPIEIILEEGDQRDNPNTLTVRIRLQK